MYFYVQNEMSEKLLSHYTHFVNVCVLSVFQSIYFGSKGKKLCEGSITPDATLKNASLAKPLIPYGTERLLNAARRVISRVFRRA